MSKKVDLNASRSETKGIKKIRNLHSFSYNNFSNNTSDSSNEEDVANENTQNDDLLKSTVSAAKKKMAKSVLIGEGVPKPLAHIASEHIDDNSFSVFGTVKISPQLKRLLPLFLVLFGFVLLILFVIFVLLLSGESGNGYGSSYGLYGYSYYGGTCQNVKYGGNLMSIEEYVAGVVNAEVGGFTTETLKTFAVAARTFIIQNGTKVGDDAETCYYDASGVGQAYNGNSISSMVNDAVEATRGLIIVYNGSPLVYYDASCIYTASQAKELDNANNYSDSYYYIRYGSKTIGGINFQSIPVNEVSSLGSFNSYLSMTQPCTSNHGWGMSQNGAYYMEKSLGYKWNQIIDYYYDNREEISSIYKGYGYSGSYPIDPNNELYRGLHFLIGESFQNFLGRNGATVGEFNNDIKSSIEAAGVGTRSGVIAAAVNLIGSLAEMGVKLNYQWGGKFQTIGVNPNWGVPVDMSYLCGPSSYGRLYDSSICFNNYRWNSLDCSGLVTWAIINGMQDSSLTQSRILSSQKISLDSNRAVCKVGGILESSGHVVLVVGYDEGNNRYIVAESTGSRISQGTGGVKLSYYSYGASGYKCGNLNDIYGD